MFRIIATTAVTLAAFAAVPARAATLDTVEVNGEQVLQTKIMTGSLDKNTPVGAEAIVRKIRAAASAVCGGQPTTADLGTLFSYKTCMNKAVAGAADQLNSGVVTAALSRSERRRMQAPEATVTASMAPTR